MLWKYVEGQWSTMNYGMFDFFPLTKRFVWIHGNTLVRNLFLRFPVMVQYETSLRRNQKRFFPCPQGKNLLWMGKNLFSLEYMWECVWMFFTYVISSNDLALQHELFLFTTVRYNKHDLSFLLLLSHTFVIPFVVIRKLPFLFDFFPKANRTKKIIRSSIHSFLLV